MKKENGDRAIGTQLAPDHPGQEPLRAGTAYKGPAVLFGRKFYTAYFPIVDPQNKTLGLLYVGNSIEIYDTMMAHAIWSMADGGGDRHPGRAGLACGSSAAISSRSTTSPA